MDVNYITHTAPFRLNPRPCKAYNLRTGLSAADQSRLGVCLFTLATRPKFC